MLYQSRCVATQRPTDKMTRVEGLDVLRGLAILGILVVSILQMFLAIYLANWVSMET